jgi:hypothetical protein
MDVVFIIFGAVIILGLFEVAAMLRKLNIIQEEIVMGLHELNANIDELDATVNKVISQPKCPATEADLLDAAARVKVANDRLATILPPPTT